MKTTILHLDLDTFFVSCERLLDRRLIDKPVLIGGTGDRGIVSACSYETRKFGIHSGMAMKMARQLCPEAICIKGNSYTYAQFSRMVTEIIEESVPYFEKTSIDEFYADLTGMDRFFGNYTFAKTLRSKIIRETGLPISIGLSRNKVVSKVATGEAKPNNQMRIDYGNEKSFLAPLEIRKLPMVGKASAGILRDLGVFNIGMLQEMPMAMVSSVLGKNGETIWQRAQGIDTRPIVRYCERKSISTERTFNLDHTDITRLKATLTAMGEHLAYQLRRENKVTGCISVKLRYSDFTTHSKQKSIPYTSADHILVPLLHELFDTLYTRRVLVRMVGINYADLAGGHYQINLFDDNQKTVNLYQAMDAIRDRFGADSVIRASTLDAKTIRDGRNPFKDVPVLYAHRHQ